MTTTIYQRFLLLLTCLPVLAVAQTRLQLADLASFKNPGSTWKIVGNTYADLSKQNKFITGPGTGILVNLADKKAADLYTVQEYGDMTLELDYMMAAGANSGIYLQSRYELQLADNWGDNAVTQQSNGAIYQRWNDNAPAGQNGYEGHAPRTNAAKAPGTWQHLKVIFQAPKFDAQGNKISNAKVLLLELNNVVLHENVELTGPTRGSVDNKEVAKAPLRLQGDHGTVAFRNITITDGLPSMPPVDADNNSEQPDAILITANAPTVHRSFMDVPGVGRLTHSISVGTPQKINYTYDPITGSLVQVWRGEFLDATPMWHDRGDGSSRPRGAVQYLGKPAPVIANLASTTAAWPADTANTAFRTKGYRLDASDMPTFVYTSNNMNISDAVRVADKAQGLVRDITIDNVQPNTWIRLAVDKDIQKISESQYLVGDKAYYLQIDKSNGAPTIREGGNGSKELIIPAKNRITYSILF